MLEFVERHRTSREQTVRLLHGQVENSSLTTLFIIQSELFGAEFQLSIHAKELIVGDIFVRIYNEQPAFVLQVRHFTT